MAMLFLFTLALQSVIRRFEAGDKRVSADLRGSLWTEHEPLVINYVGHIVVTFAGQDQ